jgi:competence protein ComEC
MPFIRLLIPFSIGILSYELIGVKLFINVAAIGSLALFALEWANTYIRYRLRVLQGFGLHAILFSLGWSVMFMNDPANHPHWYGAKTYDGYVARIITEGRTKKGRKEHKAEILMVKHQNGWQASAGLIQIRLPGDSILHPGAMIGFTGQPSEIRNIPGSAFNYRAYMARQRILRQVDLSRSGSVTLYPSGPPGDPVTRARNSVLDILEKRFREDGTRGMAKALLTGYRTELDAVTVRSYTNTGVIHVIAISGLHLGLIYGIMHMLWRPLARRRPAKIAGSMLILAALWFFTLICGATPSVTRSAVMFTGILLGDMLKAGNHTGNSLGSSAFLLLAYDPMLLWDLGFQLSYAAVASLVIYNQSISSLYAPTNGLLLLGWNSIATSLSAQILTTPLILVNFGQFPLLFILSNLVAVPLSGLILVLLILVCVFNSLNPLATVLADVAAVCIIFMNEQVEKLSSLPFAVWDNIHWTAVDGAFAYLLILASSLFLLSKKPAYLLFFLLMILTWLLHQEYST